MESELIMDAGTLGSAQDLKIAVISGGTATNELVGLFRSLSPNITYILPILDNGGSTSELIRVIGGPAIGDIRSRLTRLIPSKQEELRKLLSFRLSSDAREAKTQWNEIVDGTHPLWAKINSSTKEILRAFFIHVHVELLKRSKHQFSMHSNKLFRYELANVGNLFLTGVRLFIGSLDSAIELFSRLVGIDPDVEVLPCINTNFTYHISALLENGLIITGQSQISHPSQTDPTIDNYPPPIDKTRPSTPTEDFLRTNYFGATLDGLHLEIPINEVAIANTRRSDDHLEKKKSIDSYVSDDSDEESGNVPQYTHPELKKSQLHFNKTENIEPLLSPIKRIFYISPYGEEICPTAHNRVTSSLSNSDVIIYSIGSLMTSIVPVIILKGIGRAIANDICQFPGYNKKRILLLNGCADRETYGMTAKDYIDVIVKSATYSLSGIKGGPSNSTAEPEWNKVVSHLCYMKDPKIEVDTNFLQNVKNIQCIEVNRVSPQSDYYDLDDLNNKIKHMITP